MECGEMESLISDLISPNHKTYSTVCVQRLAQAVDVSYYVKNNSIVHLMLKPTISSSIILKLLSLDINICLFITAELVAEKLNFQQTSKNARINEKKRYLNQRR